MAKPQTWTRTEHFKGVNERWGDSSRSSFSGVGEKGQVRMWGVGTLGRDSELRAAPAEWPPVGF